MTRRNLRLAIAFLSITGLLLIPSQSLRSQNTSVSGTNLEFFHPSIDPSGYFGVNGPRLMKAGQTYFRISQSFAGNHLFLLGINNTPVDLVDKIFTTTLTASLGINDSMTFSMETPFHLYAREADFNTLAPFTTRSVGDLRMGMKFNLLTETEKAPGVALLFTNSFPTGNESKFLGTSHMVPGLEGIVGKDLALFSLAANIGMRFPQQKNVLGINFDDQITYGSGIKIPFGFFDPMLSVLGEIRGHLEPNQVQIVTAPVEFTTGLQKEFRSGLTANAGVGGAWNNAIGNPRIRGLITISFSPVWKKEGEKIEKALARQREEEIKQEALEQKRREKELAALKREKHKLEKELAYQKEREELKKQDQEAKQLADKIKKEKAELEKLRKEENRLAEEEREKAERESRDEEKLEQEQARQEATERKQKEKELVALQREKEKLEKELAYQKEREELKKQDQEAKQLADKIKKEKAELEKLRKEAPKKEKAKKIKKEKLSKKELKEKAQATAYFGVGGIDPTPEFLGPIREVALLLKQHPEVKPVRIEGHTDNTGSHTLNLALSLRRAEAVKEILIREGVDPSRIVTAGFNADRPVAPNITRRERQLNRRVEIFIGDKEKKRERHRIKEKELRKNIHTTAYFSVGANHPSQESTQWIRKAAALLREHPEIKEIAVEGHTDNIGDRSKNVDLSLQRAEAVKEILVREGIDPSRIMTFGFNADRPVAADNTPSERQLNRRVEIMVGDY